MRRFLPHCWLAIGCLLVMSLVMSLTTARPALAEQRNSILERFDSWGAFVDRWKSFAANDIRLMDIKIYSDGRRTWYVGVWHPGGGRYALYRYDNWSSFTDKWKELANQNLRLIDFEQSIEGNRSYFTGVWRAGDDNGALYRYDSWSAFTDKWKDLASRNMRLVSVDVTPTGSRTHFTGVWRAGAHRHALYRYPSWSAFTDKWKELDGAGLRLINIAIAPEGNRVYYTGSGKNDAAETPFTATTAGRPSCRNGCNSTAKDTRLLTLRFRAKAARRISPASGDDGRLAAAPTRTTTGTPHSGRSGIKALLARVCPVFAGLIGQSPKCWCRRKDSNFRPHSYQG